VLDKGVVHRKLFHHVLTYKVRAGVSDMGYRDARILNQRGHNGCSHLCETVILTAKHYRSIRLLNRAFERLNDIAFKINRERTSHRVDTDLRRELTPLRPSHAIKNNEAFPPCRRECSEFVLVHRSLKSNVRSRGRNQQAGASAIEIFSPGFAQLKV
jgi:hypothetical protein